jgi:uncharacterized NAD(P)/FAD-binding protein YdhS
MNLTPDHAPQFGAGLRPVTIAASGGPRTVVIVGAGFSGTMVASNLLKLARDRALRVVLIDRAQMARGLAYGERAYPYLLNVPAGRMSATSADPCEFVKFARQQVPTAAATDFLPRELYGRYLEFTLASAERRSPNVRLERIRGSAVAITLGREALGSEVRLSDGRKIRADAIVLAVGNPPPAPLVGAEAACDSSQYVADPWKTPPDFHAGETVLIVGTGLTMVDVVLAGTETARGQVVIHAISRHGLLPLPHAPARRLEERPFGWQMPQVHSHSIRKVVSTLRALARSSTLRGGDWREVIAWVRAHAPQLWQQLSDRERRRFLRHVRPYWDIHRHRLPEKVWSAINELRAAGILRVKAGHLVGLERQAGGVCAHWRPRGATTPGTLLVDRVINCTGPYYDLAGTHDPLLRTLLAHGMVVRDRLGLGLVTREFGRVVDASGRIARNLCYIGPMLRADRWEATAVHGLRECAEHLAWALLASLDAVQRPDALDFRNQRAACALSRRYGTAALE